MNPPNQATATAAAATSITTSTPVLLLDLGAAMGVTGSGSLGTGGAALTRPERGSTDTGDVSGRIEPDRGADVGPPDKGPGG